MYVTVSEIAIKYSNNYFADTIFYWFDLNRYEFYDSETIAELGFSAPTQDELTELLAEYRIIPSFCPNRYQFDKQFIESYRNKKLSAYFNQFEDEERYDSMFDLYTENNNINELPEFEEFCKQTAIEWCEVNGICYRK